MKRRKSVLIGIIIFLSIIGGTVELIKYFSDGKILKRSKKTTAYIFSVKMFRKPTVPAIQYFYVINNDTIISTYFVESVVSMSKLRKLEGEMLPVIYDSINVKSNKLLINVDDYK